jgi:hypothetical protein
MNKIEILYKILQNTKYKNKSKMSSIIPQSKYIVNIDFDESIKAWNSNKKRISANEYKYVCQKSRCNRVCHLNTNYCYIHRKSNNIQS